jgi:hypothetical protein
LDCFLSVDVKNEHPGVARLLRDSSKNSYNYSILVRLLRSLTPSVLT